PKPKRQGLPAGTNTEEVTLEMALGLLSLPRDVGHHPETDEMIQAGIGRFGPFLKHEGTFTSLPKDDDVMHVGMNRAVEVLAQGAEKRAAREAIKAQKEAEKGKGKGKTKKKTKTKTKKKKSTAKKKASSKKTTGKAKKSA
ncbi:MAG: DNA topoisomerase I, partial [Alphaproteobacteria bacterium]|nr:DNA topoisomerase I [Alphaproteobacteria bacterium]